jgi:hypothetical protein
MKSKASISNDRKEWEEMLSSVAMQIYAEDQQLIEARNRGEDVDLNDTPQAWREEEGC